VLGLAIHGHDANYYITDEDSTNKVDETPPDIHFEKGMHCIDCHTKHDVHGDGHLYSDTLGQVEIRCESCHGTIDEESKLKTSAGRPLKNLTRDDQGNVWLKGKIDGKKHRVTQIKQSVNPKAGKLYKPLAALTMGRDAKTGFSHTDNVQCYTCHSDWMPNCYGCHVTLDLSVKAPALTTGVRTPGKPSGRRQWVSVHDLLLMRDVRGKISPAMPAERFFLTVTDGDKTLLKDEPRMAMMGPGMGGRPVNPHTTRTTARFSACKTCHPKKDGSNLAAVRATWGFGSDRYLFKDGKGKTWRMDQMMDESYKPVIESGHPEPLPALPLSKAQVEAMKAVLVD
jgi:hypothetical protein